MGESICLIFIRWGLQILKLSLVPFCLQKSRSVLFSYLEDGAWNTMASLSS